MPEENEQKIERDEQKTFEACVDKKRKRTKRLRFKDPRLFASFILTNEPGYVWMDGAAVRKKFPQLSMSPQKINEIMDKPEFKQAVRDQIPDATKEKATGMFDTLLYKYYAAQCDMPGGPHARALTIFGQISGKYDPMQKINISGGMNLSEEKEKAFIKETERAIANHLNRLALEGKLGKDGGGDNGNN